MFAGEYAVLQTGFRVYAERHEVLGDMTRLHTATGTVDLPSTNVASFEVEEYVRPTAPPPAVAGPAVVDKPAVPPVLTAKELVDQAAATHGLRPEFVRSVASAESAFRQSAVSPKGAIGLMQLMPGDCERSRGGPE